jgi:hypothetical protein
LILGQAFGIKRYCLPSIPKTSTFFVDSLDKQSVIPARDLAANTRPVFYLVISVLALIVVIAGFLKSYIIPLTAGTYSGKAIIHVHGAMFFCWILLSIIQPILIYRRNYKIHRRLGVAGAVLAVFMILLGVTTAFTVLQRDIARGLGDHAKAFLLIPLTDMIFFALFAGLAFANVRKPETHKRLMLLASVSILPAAFSRFFDVLGITNLLVAVLGMNSFIIVAAVYDLTVHQRIHNVYLWGGSLLLLAHYYRVFIASSATWLSIAGWISRSTN